MRHAIIVPRTAVIGLAALGPLALSIGCAEGGGRGGVTVARDSAGVEIVENHAAASEAAERWRVVDQPSVEIGLVDGPPEYQLHDVTDAARFADGRIAVANGASDEIRIYSPDGEFLQALGGEGDGPGEFRHVARVDVLPGDSILALDAGQLRTTVFSPDGTVARTTTLERGGFPMVQAIQPLASGYLVTGETFGGRQDARTYRPPQPLVRYAADGTLLDTVVVAPGRELADVEGGPTQSPFFGRRLEHAVDGDRVYVGSQETFEISMYSPDGTLRRLIRGPAEDLSITDAHMADFRERMRAMAPPDIPPEQIDPMIDQILERRPMAETRPAYGAFLVDPAGDLWVSDEPPAEDRQPGSWYVFDQEGALRAIVDTPRDVRILEVGEDYVLGRWQDALEVEYVRLYRLER